MPAQPFTFAVMLSNQLNIIHYEEVDSTNSLAYSLLGSGKVDNWTIISADTQLKGRGQLETTWQDEKGANVLMSLISPQISWPVDRVFHLNMAVSLAIADVLSQLVEVRLKWPNDLFVGGKKMGGLLIEPSIRGAYVQRIIVGLGLNVYQTEWKEGVDATSLALEVSSCPEPKALIQQLGEAMTRSIQVLESTGRLDPHKYLQMCIGYNEWMMYSRKEKAFRAKFINVDVAGRQILLFEDGHKEAFGLKEVRLILDQSFSS